MLYNTEIINKNKINEIGKNYFIKFHFQVIQFVRKIENKHLLLDNNQCLVNEGLISQKYNNVIKKPEEKLNVLL